MLINVVNVTAARVPLGAEPHDRLRSVLLGIALQVRHGPWQKW